MLKVLLFLVFSINILAYTNISPLNFDERIDGKVDIKNILYLIAQKIS